MARNSVRLGGIWSSNMISHLVSSDGDARVIYAKVIPPHVIADRIWCGINVTGKANMEIEREVEMYVHASMFNIPLDYDKGDDHLAYTNTSGEAVEIDNTVDNLADMLLPLTAAEVFGEAFDDDGPADDPNVGLTGGEQVSARAKDMKIWDWRRTLKYPECAALVTSDQKIRYKHRLSLGKSGKHISGYGCDPNIGRILVIRMITNNVRQADTSAAGLTHAWGGFTNLGDMAEEFMLATSGLESSHDTPGTAAAGLSSSGTVSSDILSWQKQGWTTDASNDPFRHSSNDDEGLIVGGKVSLYCRTTQPRTNNILYSE